MVWADNELLIGPVARNMQLITASKIVFIGFIGNKFKVKTQPVPGGKAK
jgi:hypothetical protein